MMKYIFLFAVTIFVLACADKKERILSRGEGFIHLKEGKVWYRVVGTGNKTPILLLHGGPGVPSYYLNSMAELGTDRPVIFLDQLGCGRSDSISDPRLRTIESFVNELKAFTDSLHLTSFYLYGHSWGTMLGMDFYLKYPERIKGIVFASPCLSVPFWERDADSLINTLPDSVINVIRTNEKNKTYDSPAYQEAIGIYYSRFLSINPDPGPEKDSAGAKIDYVTYETMWGPSEFTATGSLKNYDRRMQLNSVKVPALFMCGEFDEAVPTTVKYLSQLVRGSYYAVVQNAAHLTSIDNPAENNRVIKKFLESVERK